MAQGPLQRIKLMTLVLATAGVLNACSALAVYNYLHEGNIQAAVTDLPYGDNPRQTLDLYLPQGAASPAPLLVWFYGGAWDSGDKAHYAFVARRFTDLGYAVAIPDYRLVPEVRFPAFISDAASALRRLRDYAGQHPEQLAPQPMVLAGHSAGAYIAVQLVADPVYLSQVGLATKDIAGIIGLSGPYDFYPYVVSASQRAFGATPPGKSQPVEQDLSQMPPLLLIAGDRDKTVKPLNSVRLAEAAPDARLELVPGVSHAGTLLALGGFPTRNEQVLGPVTEFLTQAAVTSL
jgi:acetyl esterase/lipase